MSLAVKVMPVLLVRFAQNTIRTTALLFLIMLLALATTASSARRLPLGFIAVSLITGQNQEEEEGARFWGTLLEGTWKFCDWNTIYGRFEAVDRDLFELRFKRQRPEEVPLDRTRVYAGTLGYVRDFTLVPRATTGVG